MKKKVMSIMLAAVSEQVDKAQLFKGGDRVRVVYLPVYMQHFTKGSGTIMYSYAQVYAWSDVKEANNYCILFDDGRQSCWYPGHILERIS